MEDWERVKKGEKHVEKSKYLRKDTKNKYDNAIINKNEKNDTHYNPIE